MLMRCTWFDDIRLKYSEIFEPEDELKDIKDTDKVYILARFMMEAERKMRTEGNQQETGAARL